MGLFRRNRNVLKPCLPTGLRVYAIGDIHGRSDLLRHVFNTIDVDHANSPPEQAIEVYLGDYVDRGPDSRGVVELLIKRGRSRQILCLKGNHEAFMIDVLRDPSKMRDWWQFGGLPTMMSYGLRPPINPTRDEEMALVRNLSEVVPAEHIRFLQSLPSSFSLGDYYFVHAGAKPGVSLEAQSEKDLIWIREQFLDSGYNFGKCIVHGHTPVSVPDIRHNRINIDTGAYATGKLTVLLMRDDQVRIL